MARFCQERQTLGYAARRQKQTYFPWERFISFHGADSYGKTIWKPDIPKGRLTVVTGVSGSGKTTMVLESLVPGLQAVTTGTKLPEHVKGISADGISHVKLIDATPIGINVRSTVATYANVHDELRKYFAKTADAKRRRL